MLSVNLHHWLDKLDRHSGSAVAIATVALVVITAAYAYFNWRLLRETKKDRTNREERERLHQALLVGGHIDWTGEDVTIGTFSLTLTVVNASPLPVRAVVGHVYDLHQPDDYLFSFTPMPVVPHSSPRSTIDLPLNDYKNRDLLLRLDFDEDSGVRWRKYDSEDDALRRLKPEERDWSRNPPSVVAPSLEAHR